MQTLNLYVVEQILKQGFEISEGQLDHGNEIVLKHTATGNTETVKITQLGQHGDETKLDQEDRSIKSIIARIEKILTTEFPAFAGYVSVDDVLEAIRYKHGQMVRDDSIRVGIDWVIIEGFFETEEQE